MGNKNFLVRKKFFYAKIKWSFIFCYIVWRRAKTQINIKWRIDIKRRFKYIRYGLITKSNVNEIKILWK